MLFTLSLKFHLFVLPSHSQPRMSQLIFLRSYVIQWLPNWKAKCWEHSVVRECIDNIHPSFSKRQNVT